MFVTPLSFFEEVAFSTGFDILSMNLSLDPHKFPSVSIIESSQFPEVVFFRRCRMRIVRDVFAR